MAQLADNGGGHGDAAEQASHHIDVADEDEVVQRARARDDGRGALGQAQ